MHPNQITNEHISQFGPFSVKEFNLPGNRLHIAQFPITPNKAKLAKEFGLADVFKHKAAKELLDKLIAKYTDIDLIPNEEWNKVGELEKLPEYEPLPVDIKKNILSNQRAADFPNLVWDQTTVDLVTTTLTRIRDTNLLANQPNPYTLFVGPPGTSKSKVSRIISSLLGRPLYSLNAEQVSPETLASKITGETTVAGNPATAVMELAKKGALSNPSSRREYIDLMSKKRFEAITLQEWSKIADLEGISTGSLYTVPGMASLAKKYGGIFNIEELNCLRGDGFTLLTVNVLDVYDQDNPNYYVIANMNPSTEHHHNRTALPVEISDRFGQPLEVKPLNKKDLQAVLTCNFTGFQPLVKYKGETHRFSHSNFGIETVSDHSQKSFSEIFDPKSLPSFIDNISKFHTSMCMFIQDGTLNRAESQVPQVSDHSILTRRGLSLFTQGLLAEIISQSNQDVSFSNNTLYSEGISVDFSKITQQHLINAISSSLNEYYVKPYSFEAEKVKLNIAMKNNTNVNPDQTESTAVFINDLIKRCDLTPEQLKTYIFSTSYSTNLKKQLNNLLETNFQLPQSLIKAFNNTNSFYAVSEKYSKWLEDNHLLDSDKDSLKILGCKKVGFKSLQKEVPNLVTNSQDRLDISTKGKSEADTFFKQISENISIPTLSDITKSNKNPIYKKELLKLASEKPDTVLVTPLINDPNKPFSPENCNFFFTIPAPLLKRTDKEIHTIYTKKTLSQDSPPLPLYLKISYEDIDPVIADSLLNAPFELAVFNTFELPVDQLKKLSTNLSKQDKSSLKFLKKSASQDIDV